jgi:hypothetical protein
MSEIRTIFAISALFLCLASPLPISAAESGAVDFSCMRDSVRGKTQVSDRYKEYDVVLDNRCPGGAYWMMCIERIDPWSRKIVEVHNPAGYIDAERRSRVNMQMKKGPDGQFRNRFQQFYVNVAYAIDSAADVSCVARQCEAQNKPLIDRLTENDRAIQRAEQELTARIEAECPDTGWDGAVRDNCEAEIRKASQDSFVLLEGTEQQLREQLANTAPAYCQLHGGALVPDED